MMTSNCAIFTKVMNLMIMQIEGLIVHSSQVHTYCTANWTLQLIGKKFSDAQGANCKMKSKQSLCYS